MDPQQQNPSQNPSQDQPAGAGQTFSPTATPQPDQTSYPGAAPQPVQQMQNPMPSPQKSSKMPLLIGVVVIVLIAAGVGLALALSSNKKNPPASSTGTKTNTATNSGSKSTSTFTAASVKACDAFTLTAAQSIMGSSAQASSLNGSADTSTADQAISSCSYQVLNGSTVITANVTMTGALTQQGLTTNTAGFTALKSKDGGTSVAGIGDQAFYDSKTNVLMALKGSYSIVVTYLTEASGGTTYSQTQAEQVAKAVVTKL